MEGARHATREDLAAVAGLARAARAELGGDVRGGPLFVLREARGEPLEDWLGVAIDDPDQVVVVGTIDDVVVGYGTNRTERLRDGSLLAVIDDLFVEPGARGVGVGEAIMGELLAWARERGCASVDAVALPGQRATKNFFEASGFSARLLVMHHRLREAPSPPAADAPA